MTKMRFLLLLAAAAGAPDPATGQEVDGPAREVRAAEKAFASTMAERDLDGFVSYLADEAVFFTDRVLRGASEIAAAWAPFFEGEEAPFAWAPEDVEVLESGTLAMSSGPVLDAAGERIGTFNSVWRLEPDGRWRVVFDRGCPPCDCGGS